MGNTALIATLAASLVAGVALLNADYAVLASADSQARDQEAILSERAASSAFDMAASQLKRDFGWRTGYLPTSYLGGGFEAKTTGPATGPVRIDASGASQDTISTEVTGWITRLATAAAALTVDADTARVKLQGNDVLISGNDHRARSWANTDVSENSGMETPAIGLLVKEGGAAGVFQDALGSDRDRVRGTNGNGDLSHGGLPSDFATLLGEALGSTTNTLVGDQTLSQTYGSATAPVILHVNGDATFVGGGGYGMLYVEGSFKASSDFAWEGIVVADGQNAMDFHLSGNATIRGAAYVTHTSTIARQVAIGGTDTPPYTLWSPDDERGVLRAYTFGDKGEGDRVEGKLVGWTGKGPQNGDYSDSEALGFGPDGTLYIVNNPYRWDNTGQISRLYKISPDQLDGDPSTDVRVTEIGRTHLDKTNDDEIHGLTFYQGKLYGVGVQTRRVYEMNLSTGRAENAQRFNIQGAPRCTGSNNGTVDARSLSADGDGNVYVSRKCDGGTTQLFRFDSFPDGDARFVMTVEAKISGMGVHPDGYGYGYDPDAGRIHRIDLEKKTTSVLGASVRGDIEDMALYFAGEMAALGLGEGPRLLDYPMHDAGVASQQTSVASHEVSWPMFGTVQVTTSLERDHNWRFWNYSTVTGGTLQSFLNQADLGGIQVGAEEPINLAYTGPAEMPMLDFRPSYGGNKSSWETITMEFSANLPSHGVFLYVADIDYADLHIVAMDKNGTWLDTSDWTKSPSIDVVGADDGKRTTLLTTDMTGNKYATLRPNDKSRDGETIVDEIHIPGSADVRTLKFYNMSAGDYMAIGVYNRPIFEQAGLLSVEMRDNASIRYSAESIGRLAYNIPSVAARATFELYERFTDTTVDRMFGIERRTIDAAKPSSGTGATAFVCHVQGAQSSTLSISESLLGLHLGHGDTRGRCTDSDGSGKSGRSGD